MIDRARLESWSFTALRVIAGFAFSLHGIQKLFGAFTTRPSPEMWSQGWFGGVIELICGVLISLGLVTRPAAFLASGTMAVAYIQFHWKGQLGSGLLPIVNGGELALIYCFLFLWISVRGAGSMSIDRLLARE
ncbi:MAG: DoxX family protein [Deltaproteobacteria bacterium]|nr:DoxX family protein [Deltaproteobacteria bacterium]